MKKKNTDTLLSKLLWSTVIWIFAAFLFGFIRVWGVESLPAFERQIPFHPIQFSFRMLVWGISIGIPFGIMDYAMDTSWIRQQSYWKIIIIKVVIQIGIAIFSLAVLVISNNALDGFKISIISLVFSETSLLWIIFTGIVSFFIYFLDILFSFFLFS